VIKADGSIAGYRWGVQRKRKLMNRERVRSQQQIN
jgi:O6-methylguanine-DNA--protein-cysteine methyltransferase